MVDLGITLISISALFASEHLIWQDVHRTGRELCALKSLYESEVEAELE